MIERPRCGQFQVACRLLDRGYGVAVGIFPSGKRVACTFVRVFERDLILYRVGSRISTIVSTVQVIIRNGIGFQLPFGVQRHITRAEIDNLNQLVLFVVPTGESISRAGRFGKCYLRLNRIVAGQIGTLVGVHKLLTRAIHIDNLVFNGRERSGIGSIAQSDSYVALSRLVAVGPLRESVPFGGCSLNRNHRVIVIFAAAAHCSVGFIGRKGVEHKTVGRKRSRIGGIGSSDCLISGGCFYAVGPFYEMITCLGSSRQRYFRLIVIRAATAYRTHFAVACQDADGVLIGDEQSRQGNIAGGNSELSCSIAVAV